MKQKIVFSVRVIICAIVFFGGTSGVLWLAKGVRGGAYGGAPDYTLMVSGAALCGLVCLIWWATKPASQR